MGKRTGNPNGRPSEMSGEKIKKLEEAFALDCSIGEACFYAGITKTTYYNWLEKKPELVDRFDALRENPVLIARTTVVREMKNSADVAMKYLERKRRNEFSLKVENETTIQLRPEEVAAMETKDLVSFLLKNLGK